MIYGRGHGRMSRTEGSTARKGEDEDVRDMSLADLMAAVAMDEVKHDLANAALDELHVRWGRRIDELCRRLTITFPGKLVGWQTLATELLRWLWKHADTFRPGGLSGDALDGLFYRWIEISARHRLLEILKKQGRTALAELPSDATMRAEAEADPDPEDAKPRCLGIFSPPPPGSPAAAEENALFGGYDVETREVIECLRALSPKDQYVLQISAPYFKPGEREVAIPEPEHEQMIKDLRTTKLGLRALRYRAFKKVDDCRNTKARKRAGGA
jgi:hypothetical protein